VLKNRRAQPKYRAAGSRCRLATMTKKLKIIVPLALLIGGLHRLFEVPEGAAS
jgi:hypothetical protein